MKIFVSSIFELTPFLVDKTAIALGIVWARSCKCNTRQQALKDLEDSGHYDDQTIDFIANAKIEFIQQEDKWVVYLIGDAFRFKS